MIRYTRCYIYWLLHVYQSNAHIHTQVQILRNFITELEGTVDELNISLATARSNTEEDRKKLTELGTGEMAQLRDEIRMKQDIIKQLEERGASSGDTRRLRYT